MRMAGAVTFGPGCSAQVGRRAADFGVERAVVVTDETMEKLGVADRIAGAMQEAGVETCVFAGVEPEPSVETTDAVAELAREHECQLVVGLGGGSCMDVAKAVGILLTNEGSAARYQGLNLVPKPGVPTIMIPTTAGTGSEVTFTAVLIRKSDGVKGGINDEKLYPTCSFLDPELTLSMPPRVTAATGMDALIHALEAYTGRAASPFSDLFAEEAMVRIGRHLRIATWCGSDLESRSQMLLAAFYGGLALANAGVGACHALAYPLGGMFGVGHGCANALLMPYVAARNATARPDKYARAARLLGFAGSASTETEVAAGCAAGLARLAQDLELPRTLKALKVGIEEKHFDEMAERALGVARPMANNPRAFDKKACVALYKEAYA